VPLRNLAPYFLVLAFAGCHRGRPDTPPPNVILIVFDDVGYGDLGCYGRTPSVTPTLDALAASSIRATNFYVAQPVCSASRAAILTGCYPNRVGITGALDHTAKHGIPDAATTVAELCRTRGLRTAAFGKWHLGHLPAFLPTRHGFDEFYGIPYSNDMHPAHPESPDHFPPLPLFDGERVVATDPDQDRFTSDFTARAADFIRRADDDPFFLYLAHPMTHVPLHASAEFRGKTGKGLYSDVLAELDASIATLLAALDATGARANTLVVITSDNGPWLSYGEHAGSSGGLREGKGTTFDGGVRVPCIVSWPARFTSPSTFDAPWMAIDLLPTLAAAIGAELPIAPLDGVNVLPALSAATDSAPHGALADRPLFFWYHSNDLEAMRRGRWKLHFSHRYRSLAPGPVATNGVPAPYRQLQTDLALYDLETDPNESTDVAAANPVIVAELEALANAARSDLGDSLRGVAPRRR
jgi:arylsulfatase A